jgi:hypothetical protein
MIHYFKALNLPVKKKYPFKPPFWITVVKLILKALRNKVYLERTPMQTFFNGNRYFFYPIHSMRVEISPARSWVWGRTSREMLPW